jgi:hypothetical protein
MKVKMMILAALSFVVLLTSCSSAPVTPVAPTAYSYNSAYRKTVEVLVIGCQSDMSTRSKYSTLTKKGDTTVVESVATGERFYVNGCLGKPGDRFKVSY